MTIQDSPGNNLIQFPPLTLTMAQLAQLPAETVTLPDGTTESGPTLSSLLTQAGFGLIPAARTTSSTTGSRRRASTAPGR